MSQFPDMLTGLEFRRLIARKGGLWSMGDLSRILDQQTAHFPKHKEFPDPAWKIGRTPVFAGWEVYAWLYNEGRREAALVFKAELEGLKRRKFTDA